MVRHEPVPTPARPADADRPDAGRQEPDRADPNRPGADRPDRGGSAPGRLDRGGSAGRPHPGRPGAARPDPAPASADGLVLRGVVVRYPGAGGETTAVAGVDLDVAPGEVLALLGPSGSGKSSLLRAVAGLEPVAAGTVAWAGADVTTTPVHRRGFGLMFQDGQLFPHRTVAGNVGYGLAHLPRAQRRRRVAELLDLVGLTGYAGRTVPTLSGGQAQRVALARALAPAPQLLLLDEPLSALDRGLRERLTGELRDILRATGTTALYVTHDHDEAFTVADRVAVMADGRLAQVDTPTRLWRRPVSRDVAAFLGYGPFLPAAVVAGTARTELGPVPLPDGLLGRAAGPDGLPVGSNTGGPGGVVVGVGPAALSAVVGEAWVGADDVEVPVLATRFVRGRVEADVRLPGGQRATAVAPPGTELGETVQVRLDPAGAVVVPA
ncbi:ATP-binding cassette domain-containing protein [Georgenia sp. TF02-10]|uniref:ABC transporter ATP-binding protein n=1 Tax=Georgenia sp. TF02-10 TaxID=2917725 RepID=UPI001FA7EF1E|nr:ABC transporter ATP-binding protein [Georgenia sp. TF02-10]UNX54667.1 ATP-binding cassette domain-containing protein [Georgenia sp. TF02-10]